MCISINTCSCHCLRVCFSQAYWYAALYSSGIAEIDKEAREKLTAEEIKKRIMARQMIEAPASPKPTPGGPQEAKSRSFK